MNRQTLVDNLRTLSGNRYFLSTDLDNPDGIHIANYDLDQMNQKSLKKLLKQVEFFATDKGLWIKV